MHSKICTGWVDLEYEIMMASSAGRIDPIKYKNSVKKGLIYYLNFNFMTIYIVYF